MMEMLKLLIQQLRIVQAYNNSITTRQ